jgi:hypothetical protein
MADGTLKVGTITNSAGSGNITIGSGVTLQSNVPAFVVRKSSNQTISDYTTTKVTFDTELIDTDSAFSSNKFTVPSGAAGKYYLYTKLYLGAAGNSNFDTGEVRFYLNGSSIDYNVVDLRSNPGHQVTVNASLILDLSVGDYVEIYAAIDDTSGSPLVAGSTDYRSTFLGYKIGA